MKRLLICTLLALLMATNVRGQDSTRLKRIEYVLGSSLTLSLVDYVGFDLLKVAHKAPAGYVPPIWYRFFHGGRPGWDLLFALPGVRNKLRSRA